MLSCFRSIIHTSCFRPALSATQTASFSISLTRKNNLKPSAPYQQLISVVNQEASKMEEEAKMEDERVPSSFLTSSNDPSSYKPKREFIRVFRRNRSLHPTEFSRERRVISWRRVAKQWDLGPPKKVARHYDIFHQLDIDPVDECMNPSLLADYVTSMGRIKKRAETRLTMRSQRRISKAIKRAKMMGIMPIHYHAFKMLRFPK